MTLAEETRLRPAARDVPEQAPPHAQDSSAGAAPGSPVNFAAPLPRRTELLVAVGVCAVLAAALYGPHVVNGGWYLDDWMLISQAKLSGGAGAALDTLMHVGYRPGFSFALWVLYLIGGTGQSAYLAAGVCLVVLQCWLFYAVLRIVGMTILAAAASAAILLALPSIDATRLWITAFPIWVAICWYLGGLGLASLGLRLRERRARIALHGAALVGFAIAILTYELLAPVIALTALLYVPRAGVRGALKRWAADLAVVGPLTAWMLTRPNQTRLVSLTPHYLWSRVGDVWTGALHVFRETVPAHNLLYSPLGLALVAAAAIGLGRALGRGLPAARAAAGWGVAGAVALLLSLAGLVPLVPADPYYIPRWSGIGDRLTAVSAPSEAVLLVAIAFLVATGLAVLVGRARWATRAGVAAVAAWAVTLAVQEVHNQRAWSRSWRLSQQVLAGVVDSVPKHLPPGSAVVTFRHVTNILPDDVPVFEATWDLTGAVRLAYRDAQLVAQPYMPGMACGDRGVVLPDGFGGVRGVVPYRTTWFVDAPARRGYRVGDRARCASLLRRLTAA